MSEDKPHRFYDNRQKYLSFVSTTNGKWAIEQAADVLRRCGGLWFDDEAFVIVRKR